MPLVKLRTPKSDHTRNDNRYQQLNYDEGAPFFDNPRGILVHRVRAIFRWSCDHRDDPWWIVEYWCENHGKSDAADNGLRMDPGEKLICTRCEANATAHGEKTSSELCGKHVCTGGLRLIRTCCQQDQN